MSELAVVKPQSTEQVSKVLASCNACAQPLIIRSGASVGEAIVRAEPGDVILSLERMDAIEHMDPIDRTALVQAGVSVRNLHERAGAHALSMPTGLGGAMPRHVGSCAAASLGGAHTFHHGPMRHQILGLEAVLADGRIISSLKRLVAGNAGCDPEQLFIGSGGRLGVITRLALRLHDNPTSRCTVLVSVQAFDQLIGLFGLMKQALKGSLAAFEFLDRDFYAMSVRHSHAASPLAKGCPYYAIIESFGFSDERHGDLVESAVRVGLKDGLIFDAVIARTDNAQRAIWNLHHNLRNFAHDYCPFDVFSIRIPVPTMAPCMDSIKNRIRARWPDALVSFSGSIATASLHAALSAGMASREDRRYVSHCILESLAVCEGSAPIAWGAGSSDRLVLDGGGNDDEQSIVCSLKALFDPENILNPRRTTL